MHGLLALVEDIFVKQVASTPADSQNHQAKQVDTNHGKGEDSLEVEQAGDHEQVDVEQQVDSNVEDGSHSISLRVSPLERKKSFFGVGLRALCTSEVLEPLRTNTQIRSDQKP